MKEYKNGHFTGERALYHLEDAIVSDSLFDDGESPLKEGRNLVVDNVTFGWKYPLWYGKGHNVKNCTFKVMARSGIWYTTDSVFENCIIDAPKEFRKCQNITLNDIEFKDASETLWKCDSVNMTNVKAKGDYFGMNSNHLKINHLSLDGNYCFDGSHDVYIKNSTLNSKDSFWNCENIVIENCTIVGEYFGWNSKNITLIGCHIESHQGFCYIEDLTMIDCTIDNSDLIFEYCKNIDADIRSTLDSVKNPINGKIKSFGIKELIQDDPSLDKRQVIFKEQKR